MGVGKTDVPREAGQLAAHSRALIRQTAPARKLELRQREEALRTGGVKAKIPLIQRAVATSSQQLAGGLRQTAEQLARRNIGGPFASRILAGQRLAGEQGIASIPTQMAESIIQSSAPLMSQSQALGFGGLGQAAQMRFASDVFNNQQFRQFMGDLRKSIKDIAQGAAMGGMGCLHPATLIETPSGETAVDELVVGESVLTLAEDGKTKIEAEIVAKIECKVSNRHTFLEIGTDNGSFLVSGIHPMADGSFVEHRYPTANRLRAGDLGVHVTEDIRVSGPTGIYFVHGIALGSTINQD